MSAVGRAALLLVAAVLSIGARRDPLAGRVAGRPVDCIRLGQHLSPAIVDPRTILYRETERRVWRTGPIGTCATLRSDTTLVTEVFAGQLCRNDRFRVLQPGTTIPSASCRFDRFTPYDKPAR